jgi:sulfur-carrier protein adenylyltransferase/sulfurtransferase
MAVFNASATPAQVGSDRADHFSSAELQHYQRQMLLEEVGLQGQRRLKQGRVLVVGAGGLGSPVLLYLAAAGVGTLGIVEHDQVELSNLHRQVLYDVDCIGQSKAEMARRRLLALNPYIQVELHHAMLDASNAAALVGAYDLVVDASDNFSARYQINEACVRAGKPNVSASILRFEGLLSVFVPGAGPCYRCLFPEPPPPHLAPSCAEAGVLGSLPGTLGALQATEAIKLLLGQGSPLVGRLLIYDALEMHFQTLEVACDAQCPVCAGVPARKWLPARAAAPVAGVPDISANDLKNWLAGVAGRSAPFLLDVRREAEFRACHIDGACLIPLDHLAASVAALPVDRPIVCVCQKGMRSRIAAQMLIELGFPDICSLEGGVEAWHSAQARDDVDDVPAMAPDTRTPCGCAAAMGSAVTHGGLEKIAAVQPV